MASDKNMAMKKSATIKDGKDYIPQVRELIIEYTKRLNRDLAFQNIEEELKNPAEKYTAPQGGAAGCSG